MNTGIPVQSWLEGDPEHLEMALELMAEANEE